MSELHKQIDNLHPSAPDRLFRRLLVDEEVNYLTDDRQGIFGFEVDLEINRALPGFLIIAIQKHSVLAFKNDKGKPRKLILFPSLDKLSDHTMGILNLYAQMKYYRDETFDAPISETLTIRELSEDMIPPRKTAILPDVSKVEKELENAEEGDAENSQNMQETQDVQETTESSNVSQETLQEDAPEDISEDIPEYLPDDFDDSFNDFEDGFDDAPDDFEEEPQEIVQEMNERLAQFVERFPDAECAEPHKFGDFLVLQFGIPRATVKAIETTAMNGANNAGRPYANILYPLIRRMLEVEKG